MDSPRSYYSALKFKENSPNVEDLIWINNWNQTGNLDFTSISKFDNLKYETRTCLRYNMAQTGYISHPDSSELMGNELTISFWFKVDKEILNYSFINNGEVRVPLIFWGDNSGIEAYTPTISNAYDYGISIKNYDGKGELQIPYPLEDYMNDWVHFMYSYDTEHVGRIFINGIKYFEGPIDQYRLLEEPFENIMIGNPPIDKNGVEISHYNDIFVYIDEVVFCRSCITIDHFYPYPKYLYDFYPPSDIKDTHPRRLKAGKTRYDICNDAVLITRPVYFRHGFSWEEDMITKYRFDREEPFATSYFDKWMRNRDHPGHEYKKK